MMRLVIDGQECPFDASQRLGLRWSSAAMRSVDEAREGVSVTLEVPATPLTDRIFGHAHDLCTAVSFNDSEHTARIIADGAVVHEGVAVLEETVGGNNGGNGGNDGMAATAYRVRITGGGAKWAEDASRRMMADLPVRFLTRLLPTAIRDTWEGDSVAVRFLPVVRDTYEADYASTGLQPVERIMLTDDYHPFLSVREIMRTIFAESGYEMRGEFADSELFRSLYISGAYPSSDTRALQQRMDFAAGRTADAEASADALGRVYMSPYMSVNSVGNFVDTFRSDDGSLYSTGGCMAIEDDRTLFRPLSAVRVGFEYSVRYVTDYRIASRQRLAGFDTFYTPATGAVRYELPNRFVDRRDSLSRNFSYRAVVFDHAEGARYRVVCTSSSGGIHIMGSFAARSAEVSTGSAATYADPVLQVYDSATGTWQAATGDWALYDGYIAETGRTEVAFTLRSPSQACSPTQPASFDLMYVAGADRGMKFRLLASSTLRPVFSSNAAYGAPLTFADVAAIGVRQSVVVDAVCSMFNLVMLTDNDARTVTLAPADRFYDTAARPIDISARIDTAAAVTASDLSLTAHDNLVLHYRDADGAVRRFNSENDTTLGLWQTPTGRYGSVKGDDDRPNPLFTPTLNTSGRHLNAPSALLMQVGDRDDPDTAALSGFSTRIVRWFGLQPLPAGERWGFPATDGNYPLAAFHLPPCNAAPRGATLCYEDRDGATGLHTHYDAEAERLRTSRAVTLRLRLTPDEWAALRHAPDDDRQTPTAAAIRRLTIGGQTGDYILESADDWDPRDCMARCRLIQTDNAERN